MISDLKETPCGRLRHLTHLVVIFRDNALCSMKSFFFFLHHFNIYEVDHVGREGNAIAHKLARHAQFFYDMEVWWLSMPNLIVQNIIVDSIC